MSPVQHLIIADDHPMMIDGLIKVLDELPDIKVSGISGNGKELLSLIRKVPVDIILLDLQMPEMDGIEALKIIRKDFPRIKIIVFTNYDQPKLIRDIRAHGANGYLLKNSSSFVLKEAIRAVASGENWFKEIIPEKKEDDQFVSDFSKKYQLTERETEIIIHVTSGLTTKEIASLLFLSEFTINTHRRNICRKLNVYTPIGLMNFAKAHGLVKP